MLIVAAVSNPNTPQRSNVNILSKTTQINSSVVANAASSKRQAAKVQSAASTSVFNRSDVMPVVVPRNNPKFEPAAESGREDVTVKTVPMPAPTRTSELRRYINSRDDFERPSVSSQSDNEYSRHAGFGNLDRGHDASSKSSISGILFPDRKPRDDRPIISRKVDTIATTDTLSRYQPESRMNPSNL